MMNPKMFYEIGILYSVIGNKYDEHALFSEIQIALLSLVKEVSLLQEEIVRLKKEGEQDGKDD